MVTPFSVLSVPVPSRLPLTRKVTVPVGPPRKAGETVAVKVTAWSTPDGLSEAVTVVVVEAWLTFCVVVPALPEKPAWPLKVAWIVWEPRLSWPRLVVIVARPLASTGTVPRVRPVVTLTKVTVPPDGAPAPGGTGVTVAVKVTGWPKTEGFAEEATAVVVAALITSCVSVPELALKLLSPAYSAVMTKPVPSGNWPKVVV